MSKKKQTPTTQEKAPQKERVWPGESENLDYLAGADDYLRSVQRHFQNLAESHPNERYSAGLIAAIVWKFTRDVEEQATQAAGYYAEVPTVP